MNPCPTVGLGELALNQKPALEQAGVNRPACSKTSLGTALCGAACRVVWGLEVKYLRLPD